MIQLDKALRSFVHLRVFPLVAVLVFMFVSGLVFAFLSLQSAEPTVRDLREEIYKNTF